MKQINNVSDKSSIVSSWSFRSGTI